MRRKFIPFVFLTIFGFAMGHAGLALSQATAEPPSQSALTAQEAELRSLVKSLKNDDERKKLIGQLELLLAAKSKGSDQKPASSGIGARAIDFVSERMEQLSSEIVAGTRAILDLPNIFKWVSAQFSDPHHRSNWFEIIWKVILSIAVGFAVEWGMRMLLARPRRVLETKEIDGLWVQITALLARTALDVVPIIGFVAGSYAVLWLADPGIVARDVIIALIVANVAVRLIMAVARMILAPVAGSLRLLPIRDVDANYLFIWVRRLTDVSVYGYALVRVSQLLGLPDEGAETFLKIVGLFVSLLLIVFILQNRLLVAGWLRGSTEATSSTQLFRGRVADIWHVPALIYVIAMYAVWALSVEDGFSKLLQSTILTIVIFIAARLILSAINRASHRIFSLRPEVKQRYPGLEVRANRYQPIVEKATSIVIGVVATFTILEAWGLDAFDWLRTPFGQRVTGSLITIALLLVIAIAIWEMTSAIVERSLSRGEGEVSARTRTLLPLLRTAMLVVLITIVVMVTLSELGLNIGPLLAGAGVIGLAIGFGAQTLVKDIITGLFILIEDHISVGDVVKVGTHAGTVEKLTLRTIQLRDVGGTVHVVPFSAVTTLENMTKDFSRYVFNVGVAYREDTDHVIDVLRELGEELLQDDQYKPFILEPLEILGVDSFGDNAVNIKARITTVPVKQWSIGREFNRRMKKRFDELGIEIPFPHRTIYFGEDLSGNAPPARIATIDNDAYQLEQRKRQDYQDEAASRRRSTATPMPDTGGSDAPDGD
ncbi:MAG: Mechanosensitive ion channel protein [Rhodospirillaceae bacterium]|nr:Mechanosensitive ion channel protein [Rhodospirillaceae bacterium]|tara:strand:- start:9116 stop:11428 length:2313 start_codon:yes stop_codon:yes gene_type:complete